MSTETKPVITSLTRATWNRKPVISSSISEDSSISELICYLKSAFRDKEYSLVERILIDRDKQLRNEIENLKRNLAEKGRGLVDMEGLNKENQLKEMERKCEGLKNEKEEVEAKLKVYVEKFEELERRVLVQEEEAAKKCHVDVAVIRKMVEDLEAMEEEEEIHRVHSTGNESGKSRDEGSGNTDFVSTKMNLVNCPDVQTLHRKVSNIEKKSCHSEKADPLLSNLACGNRAPIIDLSACEAGNFVKSNLNTAPDGAGSSTGIHISDCDDEKAKAYVSKSNGVGRNLTFPSLIKEEDVKETSLSKRKRSLSDSDNGDGSLSGKQKTRSIQELNCDGKLFLAHDNSHKTVFVRRCDDKDGGKSYSQPSSRRSDLYKLDDICDDSSSDSGNDPLSDKSMDMLIQSYQLKKERITRCKMFSSEDDLRLSLDKDPELCMDAVCALYRRQFSPNISSKGLGNTMRLELSESDIFSIRVLGEYLIDGDLENKRRKAVDEIPSKNHEKCKSLATKLCHQLYQLYLSKEDPLFRPIPKF
ncbi:putative leucine-rich repeat-containing protein-like isoform X2 [Capsicum annuum]|uniref:uncharacterized protein LOC107855315 isoform X1 n=1 Tax=Capsicum annuum TaxID=4072 RepID=UPI0007BF8830|nr:uncharacterized protein LOC107855315 isoform X1 [Capsicum annuum]XP_016555802.1 uncharacterized protein LOC107855315 isoform X1 [Capsicum annuum]KAF3650719.1 putative leucine-rich repeat-containing protein-like isoform X2 [Capsicum annuum]